MEHLTRRDLLRTSLAAPAAMAAAETMAGAEAQPQAGAPAAGVAAAAGAGRERLLLDFGWRFHLGHASDAAQDFDFTR